MSALPKATHILDWFPLTRRLTVLKRVLFGQEAINQFPTDYHDPLCKHLESLKWRLWHGYIGGAMSEQGQISAGVTVFTDGDPGLRCLLMSALPKATHILDWFHLTRRLTVLKRVLFGQEAINQFPDRTAAWDLYARLKTTALQGIG